jgi:5-methylcytosine-specific restriction endonuclease McrA
MSEKSFRDDVAACDADLARARRWGAIGGLLTLGLWRNDAAIQKAQAHVEQARADLAELGVITTDVNALRASLNQFTIERGVRVSVNTFADLALDGKQTYGPEWQALRLKVLARDHYQCQHEDGTCAGVLQIHHIRWLSAGGTNDMSNLVTLCRRHHGRQHPDNPAFWD